MGMEEMMGDMADPEMAEMMEDMPPMEDMSMMDSMMEEAVPAPPAGPIATAIAGAVEANFGVLTALAGVFTAGADEAASDAEAAINTRHRKLLQATEGPPITSLIAGVITGITEVTQGVLSSAPATSFLETFAPVEEIKELVSDADVVARSMVDSFAPMEEALERGRLDTRVGVNFNTGATWQRNQGNDGILPGR